MGRWPVTRSCRRHGGTLHDDAAPRPDHVLKAEERAADFFQRIADNTTDEQVRSLSTEMALEEREHIEWLHKWLEKYPKPEHDWDEDMDPPMLQE